MPLRLFPGLWRTSVARCCAASSGRDVSSQADRVLSSSNRPRLTKGEDHGKERRSQQDTPERNDEAKHDWSKKSCPPRNPRCTLEQIRLDQQAVYSCYHAIQQQ